ncbi:MAG: ATP synthase F1 subunit epsilon [Ruminococcaceae bacterium]|nr:ATP synthase F1 subunit epsilon [Oscillospiraceae bacterium]
MASFPLQVVTPKGMRFDGQAESIVITTTTGQVGIMAGHTNYMAAVAIGKVKLVTEGEARMAACGNGFLSVENGKCTVLANSFDFAEDLDTDKVRADLMTANQLLATAKNGSDKTVAKDRIALANVRLSILENE